MGYYVTVTRQDGVVIMERWDSGAAGFFFDMAIDKAPAAGVNTYTIQLMDDGTSSLGAFGPAGIIAEVSKR